MNVVFIMYNEWLYLLILFYYLAPAFFYSAKLVMLTSKYGRARLRNATMRKHTFNL